MTRRTPEEYDFKKGLFDELLLRDLISDRRETYPRRRKVEHVDIHHFVIPSTNDGGACRKAVEVWKSRSASAHYGVDKHYVAQFIYDNAEAWGNANTWANQTGIIVEHSNRTLAPNYEIDKETLETSAKLVAGLHLIHKLGRPTSTGFGDSGTIRTHQSFYATSCPGPYFKQVWKKYVAMVQTQYDIMMGVTPPKPVDPPNPPKPLTAVWGKPETWVLGAVGPDVKKLGDRIMLWSKALGLPSPYKSYTGEPYGPADVSGLQKLQKEWGYGSEPEDLKLGGNSDGYPGLASFAKLLSNPPKKETTPPKEDPVGKITKLSGLHHNVAGSDDNNGYGARNATRGPALGRYLSDEIGFDVLLTCEAGQNNLRNGISKGIGGTVGRTEWEERAKAIWYSPPRGIENFYTRKVYSDHLFSFLKATKWGAAFFGIKDGKKFSILEVHLDYRKPAKQAKQLQTIFKKWRKDTDKLGIDHRNCIVVLDGNWDGSKSDNPFNALKKWNFEEKGDRDASTFMTGKHLDGVIAHEDSEVAVGVYSRRNLSDHNPVKFVAVLF